MATAAKKRAAPKATEPLDVSLPKLPREKTPPREDSGDVDDTQDLEVEIIHVELKHKDDAPQMASEVTDEQFTEFVDSLQRYTEADFLEANETKSPAFFTHYSTLYLGDILAVRRALDPFTSKESVYIRRSNEKGRDTIFKIPLEKLRTVLQKFLIPLYYWIKNTPPNKLFPEDTIHSPSSPLFWDTPLVRTSAEGDFKARPFVSERTGTICIRLWQVITPVQVTRNDEAFLWQGPTTSLPLLNYLGLLAILSAVLIEYRREMGEAIPASVRHGYRRRVG